MVRSNDGSISFRELARRLRVSDKSVRKAVRFERLKDSIGLDDKGRRVVINPALAVEEWKANAPVRSLLRTARGESANESAAVTLDDLRVNREADGTIVFACRMSGDPDSEDPEDWIGIPLTRDVAANLGLALWTRAGGHVEDLPGMKRQRDARELAAALRAAAARLEK